MTHHDLDIRIYYEDTDAGGVVYHANHLKFAERGRTEFLRHIGYENSGVRNDYGLIFVVRRIEIDYVAPAYLDDELIMRTSIEGMRKTSFTMRQTLTCTNRGGGVISDMHVAIVAVDANNFKPVRLPADINTAFKQYME